MSAPFVKLSAVGDACLGDHPMCVGFGARSRFAKETGSFPFELVASLLHDSDVAFANLECTHSLIGARAGRYESAQMRADPRHVAALAAAGFNVVSVANNHALQHGRETFRDTVHSLRAEGIAVCGLSRETDHTSCEPAVVVRNGVRLGFLGYSLRPRQYFDYSPLYAEGTDEGIRDDVKRLARDVDAVVVSLHWGHEFIQRPSPSEVALAHGIVDSGATLVLGHHPHVLRGAERYRHGLIAYSLGNFISDMSWDVRLRRSAILRCAIDTNGVRDADFLPIFINRNYQPAPATGEQAEAITQMLADLSASLVRNNDAVLEESAGSYEQQAQAEERRVSWKGYLHFATHCWKYPLPIAWQKLGTFVGNRAREANTAFRTLVRR